MAMVAIHPATRLGPVSLTVSDAKRALAFYRDVLGFRVRAAGNPMTLTADGKRPLLELTELPGARPKPSRTTGLYHFAIRVPNRGELGRSLQQLFDTRYPLHGASDHLVSEALYLADPDRNGIEIYADRPRERWPHRDSQIVMATQPLDLEDLLRETHTTPSHDGGFALHPDTSIGHIHLHVADLAPAEAFYHGLLGFEVMQRDYPGALFVSAGGYHHHIGLNIWAGQSAPPPPPDAVGLRYFTIVSPNESEHRRMVAQLEAAHVRVEPIDAGAFVSDPSANRILLTTEGRAKS